MSVLFSDTSLSDDFDSLELWQCGNVEEDLKNLEIALMYMNADQNRYHEERLEALDSLAQSRHPVARHIRIFLLQPLIWSLLLAFTIRRLCLLTQFRMLSMVHFWTASVMAPCILLWLVGRARAKFKAIISSPDASDAEYYNNLAYLTKSSKFWSARQEIRCSNSTSDYVQCLLEQWVSCILGGIVAGMSWLAVTSSGHRSFRMNTVLLVQMVTRWGIVASLHQYPPLRFALHRKNQPRPFSWPVWSMQQLIRNQWFLWFSALDAAILSLTYPPLHRCYVPAIALTILMWCCVVQSERWINGPSYISDSCPRITRRSILEQRLHQLARVAIRLPLAGSLIFMWYQSQSILRFTRHMLEKASAARFSSIVGTFGYEFASCVCLFMALACPVCHIVAACKLFQAHFMHNASLSMDLDQFRKLASGNSNDCSWRWRYRLHWREPKRVRVVLEEWWNRFWYWLFLEGSIDEKLQQESRKLLGVGASAKSRGLTVWQRAATEPSAYFSGQDRTQWKTKAMERIARKHQYDYDRRSFDDPLGVAVYRTLGIGLGFEFDHMRKLNETEVPSIRRLQSRAAKSAIQRVNELYRNATVTSSELNQIADPIERQKQTSILQQNIDAEIQSLANRLASLVPNDLSSAEPNVPPVQQFTLGTPKRVPGTNQYVYTVAPLPTESAAVRRLLTDYGATSNRSTVSYEIDYLDPMGTGDTDKDDEFIAEWYQQNRGSTSIPTDQPDDLENYQETFLV